MSKDVNKDKLKIGIIGCGGTCKWQAYAEFIQIRRM